MDMSSSDFAENSQLSVTAE